MLILLLETCYTLQILANESTQIIRGQNSEERKYQRCVLYQV